MYTIVKQFSAFSPFLFYIFLSCFTRKNCFFLAKIFNLFYGYLGLIYPEKLFPSILRGDRDSNLLTLPHYMTDQSSPLPLTVLKWLLYNQQLFLAAGLYLSISWRLRWTLIKFHMTGLELPVPVGVCVDVRKPPKLLETRSVICFKAEFELTFDFRPWEKTDSRQRHNFETTCYLKKIKS